MAILFLLSALALLSLQSCHASPDPEADPESIDTILAKHGYSPYSQKFLHDKHDKPPVHYCRDTLRTDYAEVCAPEVASGFEGVDRKVKRIDDEETCFIQAKPVCQVTTRFVEEREACVYTYSSETVEVPAETISFDPDTESDPVLRTHCYPCTEEYNCEKKTDYAYGPHSYEEDHLVCVSQYQTYKVPSSQPQETTFEVTNPVASKICRTLPAVEVMETVCEEERKRVCATLPVIRDTTQRVQQSKTGLDDEGGPDCRFQSLSLPIQVCREVTFVNPYRDPFEVHHHEDEYHGSGEGSGSEEDYSYEEDDGSYEYDSEESSSYEYSEEEEKDESDEDNEVDATHYSDFNATPSHAFRHRQHHPHPAARPYGSGGAGGGFHHPPPVHHHQPSRIRYHEPPRRKSHASGPNPGDDEGGDGSAHYKVQGRNFKSYFSMGS